MNHLLSIEPVFVLRAKKVKFGSGPKRMKLALKRSSLLFIVSLLQIHPAGSSVRTMTVEEGTVLNIDGTNSKTANRFGILSFIIPVLSNLTTNAYFGIKYCLSNVLNKTDDVSSLSNLQFGSFD